MGNYNGVQNVKKVDHKWRKPTRLHPTTGFSGKLVASLPLPEPCLPPSVDQLPWPHPGRQVMMGNHH